MNLRIVEVPDQQDTYCAKVLGADQVQRYRGTESTTPYVGDFPEGHELSEALLGVLNDGMRQDPEDLEIHDLATATHIMALLARYVPDRQYEVVELTLNDARPEVGSRLIGYDTSICFGLSLLFIALSLDIPSNLELRSGLEPLDELRPIMPLIDVTEAYFSQRLNADGLFSTYGDAEFFLSCARALNRLHPNLWESPELMEEFEVTGLYGVHLDERD